MKFTDKIFDTILFGLGQAIRMTTARQASLKKGVVNGMPATPMADRLLLM